MDVPSVVSWEPFAFVIGTALLVKGVIELCEWMHGEETELQMADDVKDPPFAHLCVKEFRELEDSEDAEIGEKLKNVVLKKGTPDGDVILGIGEGGLGSFNYWCDRKDVPYAHLETVARFFCVENNFKQQCIDTPLELHKAHKKDQEEGENRNRKDSVFAVTKKYNMGRGGGIKARSRLPCAEKANQFKYMGTIADYNEPSRDPPKANLAYSEWKKLINDKAKTE